MDLSLTDAARLLGKSERQLRYLIQEGKLPATKHEGRWRLRREDLPLSAGQQRAQEHKRERAAQIALEVLGPQEEQAPSKRRFSVRTLRAYSEAAEVYRDLARDLGTEHPAATLLREALMLLACGCHEFHARDKAGFYVRAREQASRAVMSLLLEQHAFTQERPYRWHAARRSLIPPALVPRGIVPP